MPPSSAFPFPPQVNYLVQALPFGGVKYSGFDRFAGPEGLKACCLMKSVVIDKVPFIKTTIPTPLQVTDKRPTAPRDTMFEFQDEHSTLSPLLRTLPLPYHMTYLPSERGSMIGPLWALNGPCPAAQISCTLPLFSSCLLPPLAYDMIVKTLQYPVTDKAMPFGSGLLGMFYCPDLPSKIKSTLRLIKAS